MQLQQANYDHGDDDDYRHDVDYGCDDDDSDDYGDNDDSRLMMMVTMMMVNYVDENNCGDY